MLETRTIGPLEYNAGVFKGIIGLSQADGTVPVQGWRPTRGVIRQCKGYGKHRCGRMVRGDQERQRCNRCEENLLREVGRHTSKDELYICPGPEMYPDMETCGRTLHTRERCAACQARREWLRKDAAAQKRRQETGENRNETRAAAAGRNAAAGKLDELDGGEDAEW